MAHFPEWTVSTNGSPEGDESGYAAVGEQQQYARGGSALDSGAHSAVYATYAGSDLPVVPGRAHSGGGPLIPEPAYMYRVPPRDDGGPVGRSTSGASVHSFAEPDQHEVLRGARLTVAHGVARSTSDV